MKRSGGVDSWPPDASDLTLENAIDSVPVRLFNFIAWSVGYSQDPVMDERVAVSHSQCCKVVSICQDLIYAESKGKKQTHKAVALGMAVRQVTGSTMMINVLHGLGHSVSSSTVRKRDSALASVISLSEDVTIPRQTAMKRFTTLVWDSNDYSEETLSGKGSTHVVNGVVIQRGRDTAPAKKVFVSKKVRSVKAPEPIIQQYTSKKKGAPSLHEHTAELELRMNGHVSFQEHALRMDLAYLLCRVASSVRILRMDGQDSMPYALPIYLRRPRSAIFL